MRVTIHDVAARAGVSINTVSRVVNGRPDVHPATRARVQRAIEELGYRPNSLARSLLRRESRTVGLVVTDCTNPNTARQIRVVQQTMAAAGYAVLIFDTEERVELQRAALDVLQEKVVNGIVLTPAAGEVDSLAELARRVPLVLLNREVNGLETCDVVLNDNAGGARAAVEHLLALGHRRIAHLTATKDVSTVRGRLSGYRAALADAGVPPADDMIARAEIGIAEAATATGELLSRATPPTAILAYNDMMAVGVLSALSEAKRRVPVNVALVGYDDIVYAPYLQVPLTTVAQPTTAMAEAAARRLLTRLGGDEGPPERIILAPRLVIRASSGGHGDAGG